MRIDLSEIGGMVNEKGLPGMDVDINISSIVNYNNGDVELRPGVAVGVDDDGTGLLPQPAHVRHRCHARILGSGVVSFL